MSVSQSADFSKGSVYGHILRLSIPLIIAQLVQLLYNIVDRIYIGHMPGAGSLAITGLGLTFPVITLVAAFTNLYATGGTPLFSISRGSGKDRESAFILNNTFVLLAGTSILLMICCYVFMKPILYSMGASDASWPYARDYLQIYLLGTPFTMFAVGMNGFLTAQGFPKTGMMTTTLGAVINILLDPLFIFVLHMGIQGAAIASVIGQSVSMLWVFWFLRSKKPQFRLELPYMKLSWKRTCKILALGASGFTVQASNFAVQAVCNAQLLAYGQDLYVGVMTLLTSVREMTILPVHGFTSGAQPVLGFNYGAGKYDRIWKSIRFVSILTVVYSLVIWLVVLLFPSQLLSVFTEDGTLIKAGIDALEIYFFGFFFMAFQFAGQSVFTGLGKSGFAVFFSIFRKIIIVVPLTLLLPLWFGVNGVFLAEPISNLIGGLACYCTMLVVMKKILVQKPAA